MTFPYLPRTAGWLMLTALLCAGQPALAQNDDPNKPAAPDQPVPVAPADATEPAEPLEPVASAEPADGASQHEALRESRDIQTESRRGGEFVGIGSNVSVAENETADVVVAIGANYSLKGRSLTQAVVVLGNGEILGPVGGNSVTVLGEVRIEAPVEGDVVIVASKAYINAPIGGNVVLVASEVEFGPNTRVRGETVMVGPEPVTHPDASFLGPKRKMPIADLIPGELIGAFTSLRDYILHGILFGRPIVPGLAWCWYIVGFFFLFRLILVLLFPKPIETGATILRERALRSFLIGVIAYVLYLPVQAIVGATGIGLIAVPFIWLAFEIAGVLGKIALLRSLGGQLGRQLGVPSLDTTVGGFAAGTVVVTLIYMVPVLGGIVYLLIKPMALGAMLIAATEAFRRERPTPPPATPVIKLAPSANQPPVIPAAGPAAALSIVAPTAEAGATIATPELPPIIGRTPPRPGDLAAEELSILPRVGFWPRLGATFLDFVPIVILCGPMFRHGPSFFLLAWFAYHVGMWTWRGTTLGGIVFSLRVVRLDGRPLDFTVALVRALASCLSFLIAGLGFFWASWNPDKQSWHDLIAGTVIVRTPKSVPLV